MKSTWGRLGGPSLGPKGRNELGFQRWSLVRADRFFAFEEQGAPEEGGFGTLRCGNETFSPVTSSDKSVKCLTEQTSSSERLMCETLYAGSFSHILYM